ncbi:DUF4382 domain-containing protein [Candidatus Bathyarchaeota archaeon]|nr:DUF4382 domain-containing protein [Candidatus Bathyarchaeota archaeon]
MIDQNRKHILSVLVVVILAGAFLGYRTFGNVTLVVEMTDPPQGWADASHVYIKYSKVELHRADAGNQSGWVSVVDSEAWIDLTVVLNSSKALGSGNLQTGKYNLVRFDTRSRSSNKRCESYSYYCQRITQHSHSTERSNHRRRSDKQSADRYNPKDHRLRDIG